MDTLFLLIYFPRSNNEMKKYETRKKKEQYSFDSEIIESDIKKCFAELSKCALLKLIILPRFAHLNNTIEVDRNST